MNAQDWHADLYDQAPCGLLLTQLDGTILEANSTFALWVGRDAKKLVLTKFQQTLTVGSRIFQETHVLPLVRMQGSVREIAIELTGSGDKVHPALMNATLTENPENGERLIHIAVFEASSRRHYEQELVAAKREADVATERAQTLARTLQESLIPPSPPRVPFVDVGAAYHPAGTGDEVGGDFYDIFQVSADSWVICIGDVCGKGAAAAAVTALARHTVRAAAATTDSPRAMLKLLNEALLIQSPERFCTALCVRLTVGAEGTKVVVSTGGHARPLFVGADKSVSAVEVDGDLLGVWDEVALSDKSVVLQKGESLVMFTDGITEAKAGNHFYGEDRLCAFLARQAGYTAQRLADALSAEAVAFQSGVPRDDIAVVVLRHPSGADV